MYDHNKPYTATNSVWSERIEAVGFDKSHYDFMTENELEQFMLWVDGYIIMNGLADFDLILQDWVNNCIRKKWPENKWPSWISKVK